jgi:hypothetical protein
VGQIPQRRDVESETYVYRGYSFVWLSWFNDWIIAGPILGIPSCNAASIIFNVWSMQYGIALWNVNSLHPFTEHLHPVVVMTSFSLFVSLIVLDGIWFWWVTKTMAGPPLFRKETPRFNVSTAVRRSSFRLVRRG